MDEGVNVVHVVVDVWRHAGRRRHLHRSAAWPRAVMPDTYRNTSIVEDLAHIVGVHAIDDEGHGTPPHDVVGWPDHSNSRLRDESVQSMGSESMFVIGNSIHPDLGEEVTRRR